MKEQYYGETIARSVMFTNGIEGVLKQIRGLLPKINVNMSEMLTVINETFLAYANANFLSGDGKTNIYMFLDFLAREIELDEEAKAVYRYYYQDLIDMLNNSVTDKRTNDFYRMELAIRKHNNKYYSQTLVSEEKINGMSKRVNESIEGDLNVLFSHLDLKEMDYLKHQFDFVISPTFIDSARYLVYEYPGLVGEGKFKSRLCSTLETKEMYNKRFRRNVFRRLTLDKEEAYLGDIRFTKSDKQLYKKVAGM